MSVSVTFTGSINNIEPMLVLWGIISREDQEFRDPEYYLGEIQFFVETMREIDDGRANGPWQQERLFDVLYEITDAIQKYGKTA